MLGFDLCGGADQHAGLHGEVQGKPGFSGTTPAERAVTAGYPWAAGWEVIGHFDDPLRTIDGLMATVFHQVNILTPSHAYLGYGHGRSAVEAVDVLDFGHGPVNTPNLTDLAVYPGPGQVDVPRFARARRPARCQRARRIQSATRSHSSRLRIQHSASARPSCAMPAACWSGSTRIHQTAARAATR